jgi:hypothetical protein
MMKVALSLIVVGVGLASWLVGVYTTNPASTSAGPAAGVAVLGSGIAVTGWIRMILASNK